MKKLLLILMACPMVAGAQDNLTGLWRLKEKKITQGPPYENAVPLMIRIQQKKESVQLEISSDLGDRDTLIKESIHFNNTAINTTKEKVDRKMKTAPGSRPGQRVVRVNPCPPKWAV